jgi:hypothetical protein
MCWALIMLVPSNAIDEFAHRDRRPTEESLLLGQGVRSREPPTLPSPTRGEGIIFSNRRSLKCRAEGMRAGV